MKSKLTKTRKSLQEEYAIVNENPIIKGIVQALVMIIDLFVMFLLIWHLFAYFIPHGSWLNIVDGDSMEPTLRSKQIIFTKNSEFERGDIVTSNVPDEVTRQYPDKAGILLIKRVIGVPGDEIKITKDGIFINGELLKEEYVPSNFKSFTYKEGGKNELTLDENEYYLVGDNREVSYDSRTFGPVQKESILYSQSEKTTLNFWLKVILMFLFLLLDIFLYMLIEFVLMECVYGIIYRKKIKSKGPHTTSETVVLKGDKK